MIQPRMARASAEIVPGEMQIFLTTIFSPVCRHAGLATCEAWNAMET